MGNATTTVNRRKKSSPATTPRMVFLLLDTSWRVAAPILLLSVGGHYLDERTHHTMLFSLIGFFVSLAVATLLVYRQLCIVFPDQFGKTAHTDTQKDTQKDKKETV